MLHTERVLQHGCGYSEVQWLSLIHIYTDTVTSNNTSLQTCHWYGTFPTLHHNALPRSHTSTSNTQPYKYNGKEYDSKKGLNWYDYGARHYDAGLGRFTTVDPSAENYFNTSLYAYCGNNPINRIDLDGLLLARILIYKVL